MPFLFFSANGTFFRKKSGTAELTQEWVKAQNLALHNPFRPTMSPIFRAMSRSRFRPICLRVDSLLDRDGRGLGEHQYLAVAHDDTRQFHVHIMVNRVPRCPAMPADVPDRLRQRGQRERRGVSGDGAALLVDMLDEADICHGHGANHAHGRYLGRVIKR